MSLSSVPFHTLGKPDGPGQEERHGGYGDDAQRGVEQEDGDRDGEDHDQLDRQGHKAVNDDVLEGGCVARDPVDEVAHAAVIVES